ncbi:MAG: hypothetical protein OWT27_07835, partial [Firmicutes bacterium]|nr:hypothetical protein [Bacillota bacterium]
LHPYGRGPHIAVNNTDVETFPDVLHVHAVGGATVTYVPIWYVMRALEQLGYSSSWTAVGWQMAVGPVI